MRNSSTCRLLMLLLMSGVMVPIRANDDPPVALQSADQRSQGLDATLISHDNLVAGSLMGRDGEDLGSIKAVSLSHGGEVVHVIVRVGGVLGVGSTEYAIPLDAVRLRDSEEPGSQWLAIEDTAESIRKHPSLETPDYLELADESWVARNANQFGLPDWPKGELAPVMMSEELLDETVLGSDGREIAMLDDIIFAIDQHAGARYAILSFGGTLGIGKQHVALPFEELSFERDPQGKLIITAKQTVESLSQQQKVTPGSYPELKLRSVRQRIAKEADARLSPEPRSPAPPAATGSDR